jgi:hypothetical protein
MIIPKRLAPDLGLPFAGYWTPDETAVKQLELRLSDYLNGELKVAPDRVLLAEVIDKLPHYRRQYLGITDDNRKLIFLNAFPRKPSTGADLFENWNKEWIEVSDGGSEHWSAVYDVNAQAFVNVNVHGKG